MSKYSAKAENGIVPTSTEDLLSLLEPVWPPYSSVQPVESKSPMNYAVDYQLVDKDGLIVRDTDYFITKEEAWERAHALYEHTGLTGTITFREL